ncbi:uncharacterized protein PHALS_09172 [Plasmopara halstedii]|uniref:Uncharacterized protein n=1 Tax=Plasmopara halstedii TaxID=4781 RepID=A0A0P1AEM6_PLAHL|nr:uncharacterized protein PHALS_09172 [Plasmopara halstedii]CEG39114.1 hypothetical protein PHALS_09172 [Plasmopara halstedii]|eukprot:XP_024575483.1 hypothetical protein PHALS_09172 [Plasmopara halstedii]
MGQELMIPKDICLHLRSQPLPPQLPIISHPLTLLSLLICVFERATSRYFPLYCCCYCKKSRLRVAKLTVCVPNSRFVLYTKMKTMVSTFFLARNFDVGCNSVSTNQFFLPTSRSKNNSHRESLVPTM